MYTIIMPAGAQCTLAAYCDRRGLPAGRFYPVLKPWPLGIYTHEFDALVDFIVATERRTLTGKNAVSAQRVRALGRRLFLIRRALGSATREHRRV